MRFDLTEEPWIPVRGPGGDERELGLRALFREAPDLADLAIAFAPERVAVTRILVAVLQAATRGPSGRAERIAWLDDPRAVVDGIETYLDRWAERFDLFDEHRPFMQRPVGDDVKDTTVAALRIDWASGNNATLFDHHRDGTPPALSAGSAARALLTTLLHQPGGGVSVPFNRTDSPGSKPLLVLPLGQTLWETLVLCSPAYDGPDDDVPIWERYDDDHTPDKGGTMPLGWLDRLTWRSRAVRLLPGVDGTVSACRIHQHLKLADGSLNDAHAAVLRTTGDEPKIVRLSSSKRLWRQADAILRGVGGPTPRSAVDQAVRTLQDRDGHHPQVLVSGLQIDQAKIGDAQSAVLPVSRALLEDEDRIDRVRAAIELAEEASLALGAACGAFHAVLRLELTNAARTQWQQAFWGRIAPFFPRLLRAIADADGEVLPDDPEWSAWVQAVGREAQLALDLQLNAAPAGAAHEAHARATNAFRWRCGQANVPLSRTGRPPATGTTAQEPSTITTGAL